MDFSSSETAITLECIVNVPTNFDVMFLPQEENQQSSDDAKLLQKFNFVSRDDAGVARPSPIDRLLIPAMAKISKAAPGLH